MTTKRRSQANRKRRKCKAIGNRSERIAAEALAEVVGRQLVKKANYVNKLGYDFTVELHCGCTVRIEVKSSFRGKKMHLQKYGNELSVVLVTGVVNENIGHEDKTRLIQKMARRLWRLIRYARHRHRCDKFSESE